MPGATSTSSSTRTAASFFALRLPTGVNGTQAGPQACGGSPVDLRVPLEVAPTEVGVPVVHDDGSARGRPGIAAAAPRQPRQRQRPRHDGDRKAHESSA